MCKESENLPAVAPPPGYPPLDPPPPPPPVALTPKCLRFRKQGTTAALNQRYVPFEQSFPRHIQVTSCKIRSKPKQLTANSPFNGPACFCTAQHSTAQHSTAQHSTAQHSTAQHAACTAEDAAWLCVRVLTFQGWQNLPGQMLAELSGGHRVGGGHGPRGF